MILMNYRTANSNMEANLNYIEGFQKNMGIQCRYRLCYELAL